MRIGIFFPKSLAKNSGNRVTATRWASFLEDLGHEVTLSNSLPDEPFDAHICLHALKTAKIANHVRNHFPNTLLIVAITGTDVRADSSTRNDSFAQLAFADAIVCLNPRTLEDLPQELRSKAHHIPQSADVSAKAYTEERTDSFRVLVAGHLREEKDPFRTALASRLLPESSRLEVRHFGGTLDPSLEVFAREENSKNPRYSWGGEIPHEALLQEIQKADLIVQSSRVDEAPSLLSETIVAGKPLLISSIPGLTGVLGTNYEGIFEVENTEALAALLLRAEQEKNWVEKLKRHVMSLQSGFTPATERKAWEQTLGALRGTLL